MTDTYSTCNVRGMDWKARVDRLIAKDVSLDDIANAMGVTPNAVREIRDARTKQPRANAALGLLALCQKHGIGKTSKAA